MFDLTEIQNKQGCLKTQISVFRQPLDLWLFQIPIIQRWVYARVLLSCAC
ncbi:hypothetical protein [Alysiella sp.]|nr:hypothetical protein [Alysiella sp.]